MTPTAQCFCFDSIRFIFRRRRRRRTSTTTRCSTFEPYTNTHMLPPCPLRIMPEIYFRTLFMREESPKVVISISTKHTQKTVHYIRAGWSAETENTSTHDWQCGGGGVAAAACPGITIIIMIANVCCVAARRRRRRRHSFDGCWPNAPPPPLMSGREIRVAVRADRPGGPNIHKQTE